MTILPLTYLGNIEYFSALYGRGDVVIDLGENYVKQTYRNRCEIMTAGGVATLTVNVVKGGSIHKKPMKEVRIDYSKRWQHQHRESFVSAYRNSPYFDHYRERFEPFLEREHTFLADLNRGLLETVLACLKITPQFRYSDSYVEASPEDTDLRGAFSPIRRSEHLPARDFAHLPEDFSASGSNGLRTQPYWQVFSDRYPFAPNLSIIDLLFCEGPYAKQYLINLKI